MLYFNSIPKILTPDVNGEGILLTNLMARSEIIPSLLNNPMMFYKYDIQEGDTPEIIADKYYGDSYRYWIVLFANQIGIHFIRSIINLIIEIIFIKCFF